MDVRPKVYIEQTGRSLNHRLAEHRCALKNGDEAASALAEHTLATGHPVALTKVEVIDHHPYITARCLLESWHIQRNWDTLNREKGTLPEVYTAVTVITRVSINSWHLFILSSTSLLNCYFTVRVRVRVIISTTVTNIYMNCRSAMYCHH